MSEFPRRVRVVVPLLAVRSNVEEARSRFLELDPGSIIWTSAECDRPGLLPVMRGDEQLLVFARDLRERTEPVSLQPGTVS